jgi:hypothetical protein
MKTRAEIVALIRELENAIIKQRKILYFEDRARAEAGKRMLLWVLDLPLSPYERLKP